MSSTLEAPPQADPGLDGPLSLDEHNRFEMLLVQRMIPKCERGSDKELREVNKWKQKYAKLYRDTVGEENSEIRRILRENPEEGLAILQQEFDSLGEQKS